MVVHLFCLKHSFISALIFNLNQKKVKENFSLLSTSISIWPYITKEKLTHKRLQPWRAEPFNLIGFGFQVLYAFFYAKVSHLNPTCTDVLTFSHYDDTTMFSKKKVKCQSQSQSNTEDGIQLSAYANAVILKPLYALFN